MSIPSYFFVGTQAEVQHHVAPLMARLPIQIISPNDVVERANPGDLAIFYSEHFDRFRNSIQKLKRNQVATLYLIDGILEWRNAWENRVDEPACPFTMRPVLAHKAACIGASQARVLDNWGNRGKTEIVGVPRFDDLKKGPTTNKRNDTVSPDVFRVLVMTAKTPAFTEKHHCLVRKGLTDLKLWIDEQDGRFAGRKLEIEWRLTGGLDREIGVQNKLLDFSGGDLQTALTQVDAAVSTTSTAVLEAMLLDLPVATLDYHQSPNYLNTAWNIRSADAIEAVMQELLTPPESKMMFQRSQLADTLFAADQPKSNATDRVIALIQEMAQIAERQVAQNQPLSFPENILPLPTLDGSVVFNHAKTYPGISEFGNSNMTELQVELSHARREIQYLQREMAQLQSELDLAHSIFDSIQQHPVAGPIVRLRQKFLDWFARHDQKCETS